MGWSTFIQVWSIDCVQNGFHCISTLSHDRWRPARSGSGSMLTSFLHTWGFQSIGLFVLDEMCHKRHVELDSYYYSILLFLWVSFSILFSVTSWHNYRCWNGTRVFSESFSYCLGQSFPNQPSELNEESYFICGCFSPSRCGVLLLRCFETTIYYFFFTMKYRERIPNRRRGFSFHVNNDLLSSCYLGGLFEGTLPSLTKELNVYTFLFTQTVHSTGTLPIRERDQSYLSIYLFKKNDSLS